MHKRNIQKLTILQEFEDGISFCSLWVGEGAILCRIYKTILQIPLSQTRISAPGRLQMNNVSVILVYIKYRRILRTGETSGMTSTPVQSRRPISPQSSKYRPAARKSTSWTKRPVCCALTASCTPRHIIRRITALFRVHTPMTAIRSTFWFSVRRLSTRWWRWTAIPLAPCA